MGLMKNIKVIVPAAVVVCIVIISILIFSGSNKTSADKPKKDVKEIKTETLDKALKAEPKDEEEAVKAVTHEDEVHLDDLINTTALETVPQKKEEISKNKEMKADKLLAKTDTEEKAEELLTKVIPEEKTVKTIEPPVKNYRDFKSAYINFRFNANDWEYSFGKDMNISDSIVFPKRKPYIILEFFEKPDYKNHVILYVADADKMSDFAESKGEEPIDYVKYLFNEYSCNNLSINEINKNKIVTGNISAKNSAKSEQYYITSRHDLLFILISNNQNEKEKELVDSIIDSI
jgi:hypothetical protein